MVVWGLGLGSWIGFLGLGLSVDGVWGLGCGAFWVLWGWGSLYNHKRNTLGKKMVLCAKPLSKAMAYHCFS